MIELKTCRDCKQALPFTEFYKYKSGKPVTSCKRCKIKEVRENQILKAEYYKASAIKYRRKMKRIKSLTRTKIDWKKAAVAIAKRKSCTLKSLAALKAQRLAQTKAQSDD